MTEEQQTPQYGSPAFTAMIQEAQEAIAAELERSAGVGVGVTEDELARFRCDWCQEEMAGPTPGIAPMMFEVTRGTALTEEGTLHFCRSKCLKYWAVKRHDLSLLVADRDVWRSDD